MTRREQMLALFPYIKGKEMKYNNGKPFSLSNKKSVIIVIRYGGYHDIQRHLSGIGKHDEEKKQIFEDLSEKILILFSKSPLDKESFDSWHYDTCESIISSFEPLINNKMTYGKAQKLLNITLKHTLCFNDASDKNEWFKWCHIPIDSYVIEWYQNNVENIKITEWTKMNYEEYIKIQNKIREYLSSENNTTLKDNNGYFTALESDFYIWKFNNFRKSTENWLYEYSQITAFEEWGTFKNDNIYKQLNEMKKHCNEIIRKIESK